MCGIAGVVALDGNRAPEGVVERMTAVLHHRGPDDFGHRQEGACVLGHRRLKIIDLSAKARQPLSNEDDTVWLTYNGEVYNFVQLRAELEEKGHSFRSQTDSEVIVHLYEERGSALVERLDGMFSFGVWDSRRRTLVLARDRLGIKPLYYARAGNLLLFASEIKALLATRLVKTRPNIDAVVSYLGYRHPVGAMTMFEGISALPAGHVLIAKNGDFTVEPYWDLDLAKTGEDRSETHYVEGVQELLAQAVQKRLMSDVPLGAYLSGGLDSSVVVALMAGELGDRLKTYSVGFQEAGSNEFEYARLVADRFGADHHEVVVDQSEYLDLLPELIYQRDAPLAVPNEVPLYLMSRELKQDITVVLSGEGADEIFAGYGDYVRIPFDLTKTRFMSRVPQPLRGILMGGMEQKYGGRLDFEDEQDHFLAGYKWFGRQERLSLLTEEARSQVTDGGGAAFDEAFDRTAGLPYYDRVLYTLEKIHLQNLLARVDSMTMASAVEARVPFVDHKLVEFAASIPLHYKLRWRSPFHRLRAMLSYSDTLRERDDTAKYVLRKAFGHLLPREVVERRKVGFKVPMETLLRDDLMKLARNLLLSSEARSRGILDVPALEVWLQRGDWANGFGEKVWMMVNLELWFRLYFPDGVSLSPDIANGRPEAVRCA